MFKNTKKNFELLIIVIIILIIILVLFGIEFYKLKNNNKNVIIPNNMVKNKYNELNKILGKPNYIEIDAENKLKSATWSSPLDNFHHFGKYGGCDYIKIHGTPSKKYHPHPAILFLIIGKYIKVPEILFGPLKYASETINIEQLFVPKKYSEKYYNTGIKDIALVTGSCASITISAITVQFVIDMINEFNNNKNENIPKLNIKFRQEYDRRIDDYLCGRGITDKIEWFDNSYFNEPKIYNIGEEKCNKTNIIKQI